MNGTNVPKQPTIPPMPKKLKPCPFCGGDAYTFQFPLNDEKEMQSHPKWQWNYPGQWVIGCGTPLCIGEISNMPMVYPSEQDAIETWNRRADT